MAEGKSSVIVYRDWITIFDDLTDDEAGKLIKHFFRYVNDLNPEPPDRVIGLLFKQIQLTLKRDLKKWESIREKRSEAGKASAAMRQQNQQVLTSVESVQQTSTNPTVSVSDSVTVSVSDNKKKIDKRKSFIPPSEQEVKNYFIENGYKESVGLKAWKYYETGNWCDAKGNKVKNWKQKMQAVWFKEENLSAQPQAQQQPKKYVDPNSIYL